MDPAQAEQLQEVLESNRLFEEQVRAQQGGFDRLEELVLTNEAERQALEAELAESKVEIERLGDIVRMERQKRLDLEAEDPNSPAGDRLVEELRMDLGELDDA